MGKDWLTLQIKHNGEQWSVDLSHTEHKKMAFAEKIIALSDKSR